MEKDLKIRSRDFPNICRVCLITGDLKPLVDGSLSEIFKAISEIEVGQSFIYYIYRFIVSCFYT